MIIRRLIYSPPTLFDLEPKKVKTWKNVVKYNGKEYTTEGRFFTSEDAKQGHDSTYNWAVSGKWLGVDGKPVTLLKYIEGNIPASAHDCVQVEVEEEWAATAMCHEADLTLPPNIINAENRPAKEITWP